MALIDRIEDLIKAEFNALLDKADDPKKNQRQILTELEEALTECRSTVVQVICEQKALVRREQAVNKKAEQWQQQAEYALQKDREDLARAALMEKQACQQALQQIEEEAAQLQQVYDKLEQDAQSLSNKLAQLRQKEAQLARREHTATTQLKARSVAGQQSIAAALTRFEHLERKVERVEAEVDSYELVSNEQAQWQALETLAREEQVDKALAELKQRNQPA
ncbi:MULTISPECIES: PspA/IM30 family protein [Pseudoalteromonas]|uniref:Phage shock protein A n=1 Tax=Pseudoalteromonas rubra TaxID=43658 RepID=A0A5S3V2Q9_9GAMM|nr:MULTISPECIES: PspA/IM30 family protein [Pseudoalteromonas]MCG7562582.1 PspA/IM30 family protein [Pseudoalteromonas sp. McH1-42]QPB84702.1 phage shock protein A [Pseudoalteromonas rubra]